MQLIPIVIGSAFLRLDAHAAATNDTPPITPTTTTPPPAPTPTPTSTPAPWGALAPGCSPAFANAASAKSSYTNCAKATGFTFDLAVAKPVVENTFCRSTACLFLYRDLKSISNDAVYCANVPGLQNVRLDTLAGPTACFGAEAASGKSDVIVRPGDKSSSGSGGSDRKPTTEPPVTTTPVPTTTEPPTAAPVTTKPSKTPKPSTKIPRTDHSGSGSDGTITTVSPAPVDNKKNSSSSGGLDQGTIIAIVLVSIGVVGVVIALIYVSTRKSKRKRSRNRSTNSGETVTHELLASYYGDPVRPSGSQMPRPSGNGGRGSLAGTMTGGRGSLRGTMSNGRGSGWHSGSDGVGTAFAGWDEELIAAVRIPYEKLTFDELLSRGGYGEVYRGTYRSEPVAIKTLLPERRRDMQQIQNFLAEVKMMANMEHERIVRFIGVAWDSLEELSVVSEFLERGDLRTVLAEFEQDGSRPHGFDEVKVKISLHVAHGLTYMHTLQPIVLHRDLKSRNILLDTELNAKITDFGVSRERSDRTMTAGVGSSLWMAPEVMMGERYDEKADIFSLGVVLSELDNHVLPYSHAIERTTGRRMPDAVILQMVSQGKMRVAFSDETKSEMAQIGIKCVALVPSERPTAAEVLYMIHQVWRRYEASKTN